MAFKPDFEIAHIGVNLPDEGTAAACADLFETLFGLARNPDKESRDASFTGTQIEWLKAPGKGVHGHIALATRDLPGAREYLAAKGLLFNDETIKRYPDGRILVITSDQEIGGYAIQLMQI
ncbi:MAG: hypothetical protein IKG66_05250 [Lachnospiraceae bacterium]|nr:hypothetical protein [Lachnospiraceae bacterium]